MTYPNVADLSSAQGRFDAAAYAASGRVAVIIKSTESTTYHFTTGDQWEHDAIAQGLVVGRYHWCGSSTRGTIDSPSIEGDWFLRWNGEHTPGRFAAGDMENPLPGHGPALYGMSPTAAAEWLDEFLDYIATKGGWPGLGYSFSGSGVVQRIRHAKWPASYPTLTVTDAALHQFSSSAPVPGVGNCDDSHCFIDLRAFAGSSPSPDLTVPIAALEEGMFTVPADAKEYDFPVTSWAKTLKVESNGTSAKVAITNGKDVLVLHDRDWFADNESFTMAVPAGAQTLKAVNWGSGQQGPGSDNLNLVFDIA